MKIFTKSYSKDFEWFYLAFKSVTKLCKEPLEWHVVIEDEDLPSFKHDDGLIVHGINSQWPESRKIANGYLRQQWIKMNAHRIMGNDLFLYWDSDVIAKRPFYYKDFLGKSGRPIYWFCQFNSLMGGTDDAAHYQRMGMMREVFRMDQISLEWMRSMPILMYGEVLKQAEGKQEWNNSYDMMVKGDNRMSEFNVIGQFANLYFPDAFEWRNASHADFTFSGPLNDKRSVSTQSWSWNGVIDEIKQFVDRL